MSRIKDLSERYADYILGWDHAIRRAALELNGAERDLILSFLKQSPPERDFPRPSGKSFL